MVPLGVMLRGDRWRTEALRALSRHCLLWFGRGSGRLTVAGRRRGWMAPSAHFVPAGVIHCFEAVRGSLGQVVFLSPDLPLALGATPLHTGRLGMAEQGEITALLDRLAAESVTAADATAPAEARLAAQALAGLLSVTIARHARRSASDGGEESAADRLMVRFATLVERDFRDGASVADYARGLGVTPTHLARVCRAVSGRTAHDFVQERVLFEARRLLESSRMPVREVAAQLGFLSAAHFSRVFSAHTGTSPSAFRATALAEADPNRALPWRGRMVPDHPGVVQP
ncbi:MAG: helix-turn-helix domain-containing protein [Rhodobacteraceae bacterium]|nr:helix-turn-helix domain-containing protein [Paracoccaceae bacterium]